MGESRKERVIRELAAKGFRVQFIQGPRYCRAARAVRSADGAEHYANMEGQRDLDAAMLELQCLVDAQWQREMAGVPGDPMSAELERLCSLAVHGEEPPGFNAADQ
mgnify:CR=1 FL=1